MASTTEQRMAEYEDLFRKAQGYDQNAFRNEFEKSYGEATNYNQDLINQQAQSLGELQAVAPTLREKYMNTLVTDPARQMALIAQARQAPITNYATAANLLTARGNRYQDILGKALGGYQTSAQQAQTAAENAWRLYQDAIQQEQFNRQLARSGGGGGGIDLSSLFAPRGGQPAPQESPLDITVDDKSLTQRIADSSYTRPIAGNSVGITNNPFTTFTNLVGNLIGNTMVPKRSNQSFLDKLFNR